MWYVSFSEHLYIESSMRCCQFIASYNLHILDPFDYVQTFLNLFYLSFLLFLLFLCVKDRVTLSITPVAGRTTVQMTTAGIGGWQTSLQYPVWTTPQEVHQVSINFLLCASIIFSMIKVQKDAAITVMRERSHPKTTSL